MCERLVRPAPVRRFPSRRVPGAGLTIPAPRPLTVPAPHRPPPPKLVETFDGEPGDDTQAPAP